MLSLPTHLTIQHLFDKQRKITVTEQKPSLKEEIQEDQIKQIQEMLRMTISDEQKSYDSEYVRIYLLIKINALIQNQCNINKEFIDSLIYLYNSGRTLNIKLSKSDEQFFAQVILQAELFKFIKIQSVQNVLSGQCLLATSLAIMVKQTQTFLKKAQITFSLSFLALSGRPQAFIHAVHKQKNHEGEINFAKTVAQYIKIDNPEKYTRIQIENRRVQDPYSMRCSPQVYGVVYECINFLKNDIDSILNKFHFKNLLIKGKEYQNIDIFADSEVLKGDFLICSLNQIGSMSFLRAERILNIYLGKNEVHKQNPKEVFQLKSVLQKTIHLVADNKLLSAPSNGDTMNIDNYEKDVYFTPYKVYEKFTKMLSNLYKIMLLEIQTAILGLENVYNIDDGQIFLNSTIKKAFFDLQQNCSGKQRKNALFYIKNKWNVAENSEEIQI